MSTYDISKPLSLKDITSATSLSDLVEIQQYNNDQIKLYGGGDKGDKGDEGMKGFPGATGKNGQKGDNGDNGSKIYFEKQSIINGTIITNPNYTILDTIIDIDGNYFGVKIVDGVLYYDLQFNISAPSDPSTFLIREDEIPTSEISSSIIIQNQSLSDVRKNIALGLITENSGLKTFNYYRLMLGLYKYPSVTDSSTLNLCNILINNNDAVGDDFKSQIRLKYRKNKTSEPSLLYSDMSFIESTSESITKILNADTEETLINDKTTIENNNKIIKSRNVTLVGQSVDPRNPTEFLKFIIKNSGNSITSSSLLSLILSAGFGVKTNNITFDGNTSNDTVVLAFNNKTNIVLSKLLSIQALGNINLDVSYINFIKNTTFGGAAITLATGLTHEGGLYTPEFSSTTTGTTLTLPVARREYLITKNDDIPIETIIGSQNSQLFTVRINSSSRPVKFKDVIGTQNGNIVLSSDYITLYPRETITFRNFNGALYPVGNISFNNRTYKKTLTDQYHTIGIQNGRLVELIYEVGSNPHKIINLSTDFYKYCTDEHVYIKIKSDGAQFNTNQQIDLNYNSITLLTLDDYHMMLLSEGATITLDCRWLLATSSWGITTYFDSKGIEILDKKRKIQSNSIISTFLGDNAENIIIKGCELSLGTISAGILAIGTDLVMAETGSKNQSGDTKYIINDVVTGYDYDGNIITKVATIDNVNGTVVWDTLKKYHINTSTDEVVYTHISTNPGGGSHYLYFKLKDSILKIYGEYFGNHIFSLPSSFKRTYDNISSSFLIYISNAGGEITAHDFGYISNTSVVHLPVVATAVKEINCVINF